MCSKSQLWKLKIDIDWIKLAKILLKQNKGQHDKRPNSSRSRYAEAVGYKLYLFHLYWQVKSCFNFSTLNYCKAFSSHCGCGAATLLQLQCSNSGAPSGWTLGGISWCFRCENGPKRLEQLQNPKRH